MFDKYADKIKELKSFNKEDILIPDFNIYSDKKTNIYYAPHNEIINYNAKIFIVGITPGWTQTSIAYKTANECLNNNENYESIKYKCKRNSRFAGSMRNNIIEMLDELDIPKYLNISSSSLLFDECDHLLHTTSIIPYPVFINNKNYTGSNPKIIESDILYNYVRKYFYNEAKNLKQALFIPLGKSVEEVLKEMIGEGIIDEKQCLFGFPHPSGANGHRKKQFALNKEQMKSKVKEFFEKGRD